MDLATVFFIAVGLAMDCFAVSITSGLVARGLRVSHALRIAFFFGAFQAVMPVLGWFSGYKLRDFISGVDHWIAFGLLSLVGLKMLAESREMEEEKGFDPLDFRVLVMLSLATSIDSFAVGLTLAFLKVSIILPSAIIGAVTFVFSYAGVIIGERFGHLFERKAEAAGGLILIGIGIKILVEHLS